ncbi:MAG: hypothetical protein F6K17_34070, partial [Okeania sp. SIO3C4]|nr:hypothetical protein [Okeania sp. SIO3C4]
MVMEFPLKSTLPDELRQPKYQTLIRTSVTQLSQLVAWTWYDDYLAFGKDANEDLIGQEKLLKKFVIEIFINQSIYSTAFLSYNDQSAKILAEKLSTCIDHLFKSENDQIKPEDIIPVDM